MGANVAAQPASLQTSEDLLDAFERTGSPRAFEEVVRRHADAVYVVCYQVTKNAHDAEDATQAVFLTLAVHARTSNEILNVGAWLVQVARRTALDLIRSRKRRRARESSQADDDNLRFRQDNPAHILGMHELKAMLRDEIGKLPAKYRLPLILHYFGGMKADEMSAELRCRPKTLAVRLFRARKLLGDQLRRRGITIGGSLMTVAVADAILSALSTTFRGAAASAIQTTAPFAASHSAAPFASAIASRVLRIARTCVVGTRFKLAIVGLLMVSATMANPSGAVGDFLAKLPGPKELLQGALERLTRSFSDWRPQFHTPMPQISSNPPQTADTTPIAVAPLFTPIDLAANWNVATHPIVPLYTHMTDAQVAPESRSSFVRMADTAAPQAAQLRFDLPTGPVTLTGPSAVSHESARAMQLDTGLHLASAAASTGAHATRDDAAHARGAALATSTPLRDIGFVGASTAPMQTLEGAQSDTSSVTSISTSTLNTPEPGAALLLAGAAAIGFTTRRRRREHH